MPRCRPLLASLLTALALLLAWPAQAQITSTKHNLSSTSTGSIRATGASTTTETCVFCHTPHAANKQPNAPLWNRTMSSATYTPYTSSSLDAETILNGPLAAPGSESKMCLSCHDGTLAIGTSVVNAPGSGLGTGITTTSAAGVTPTGSMPSGSGTTSGFTRRLGTDLRNDHPISVTYSSTLAIRDGEMRTPPHSSGGTLVLDTRTGGKRPLLPLDATSQVQCTTCHEPHKNAEKFLRANRFQTNAQPTGGAFNIANDQICLACHKTVAAQWSGSAHADSTVADEQYVTDAATRRDFPANLPVWRAGCLNCHDTHTVAGSRRLLREGVGGGTAGGTGASQYKSGNAAADASTVSEIQETCYQCHQGGATKVIGTGNGTVPNIKTEFARARRMPITTNDQAASVETHDIGSGRPAFNENGINCTADDNKCGADFIERPSLLGKGVGNLANRHAECTDCHNPHRVIRGNLFDAGIAGTASITFDSTARTHTRGRPNSNLASGALRGTWGVEPTYATNQAWLDNAVLFEVKRGNPSGTAITPRSGGGSPGHLTREYQLCFKCHSHFAYQDNGEYGTGSATSGGTDTKGNDSGRPKLGSFTGGTPISTLSANNYVLGAYTNQVSEWAVRANDDGTGSDQGGGANKRSWHPVTYATGRTLSERAISGDTPWLAPFNSNVGTQTMYCSDCHGSKAAGAAEGPHGSDNNFILKGNWGMTTNNNAGASDHLCFNCHVRAVYATGGGNRTGFCCDEDNNLHSYHATSKANKNPFRCTVCHVAIPHGWKNKAFLVNLNDVGPEGGLTAGTTILNSQLGTGADAGYLNPPYYLRAKLKVSTWQASGAWTKGSCEGENWMKASCGGQ